MIKQLYIYIEYIYDTDNWLFLPKRNYSYHYDSNDTWIQSSDIRCYYDNCSYGFTNGIGLMTKIEEYYDETSYITSEINYDSFGNVQSVTDAEGNSTTFAYDNIYKNYLITKTSPQVNGINIVATTEYNSLMLPYREIDANGAVTESVYDVFNRVVKIILPGDTLEYPSTEYEYHEADGSDVTDGTPYLWMKITKRETAGQNNTYDSYSYFDGLGNVVQTKTEVLDENGTHCWITVNKWTAIEGNVQALYETLPFHSVVFTYDRPDIPAGLFSKIEEYNDTILGKVNKIINVSGLVTYEYKKHYKTTIIDVDEHVVESEFFPRINERRSYSYTGIYPLQLLYTTTKTIETFDQIKVIDNNNNEIIFNRDWLGRDQEIHDPDMGIWFYEYNDNGNLIEQTDANNNIITIQYDVLNRIVKKTYPDTSFILYNYDGLDETGNPDGENHGDCLGRLTRVFYSGGLGSESYKYDLRGRLTEVSKTIDGKTRALKYEYDAMDRIVKEIMPDYEELIYTYSEGGNLTSATGDNNYAYDLKYTPTQKLCSITYGNGITTSYDYFDQSHEVDPYSGIYYSNRLKEISTNGIKLLNSTYTYDKSGNIMSKNDMDYYEFSEIYSYDDLNRLTSAYAEIYGDKSYSYDELNNIISKDERYYTYSLTQPHAVVNDSTYEYVYDNNGNMIEKWQDGALVHEITYDYENRITYISDGSSFFYDHDGNRIIKQEGTVKTIYFFRNYEEVYDSDVLTDTLKYYFAANMMVAQSSSASGLVYIHSDHLGSSVRICDTEGKLVNISAYTPFGEELEIGIVPDIPDIINLTTPLIDVIEEYKARDTINISTSIEGTSDIYCEAGQKIRLLPGFKTQKGIYFQAAINYKLIISPDSATTRYKFTGKELDSSGLYYFGARYYDPKLGRFIQADPILDGLNWYVYCGNNPLLWVDPSGLKKIYNDYGYYDDETGTFTNFDTSTTPFPTADHLNPIPTPNPLKPEPAQKYTLEEGLAHYKRQQQMLILQLGDAIIQKYGSIKVPTSLAIKIGKEYLTSLEDLVAALPFITDLKAGRKGFTFYFENDTRISYDYDLNLEYYQSHPKTQFSFNAGRAFGFDDDPDIYMLSAFVLTLQSVQHIAYSKYGVIPQGLTRSQYKHLSKVIRNASSQYSDDIYVHGSRASGTALPISDIDIAIRVSPERFKEIVTQRLSTLTLGSDKWKTIQYGIEVGKLQRGEIGLSGIGRLLEKTLGMKVDISVIEIGGVFDAGPYIPLLGGG